MLVPTSDNLPPITWLSPIFTIDSLVATPDLLLLSVAKFFPVW
jgi:hypothetical protein